MALLSSLPLSREVYRPRKSPRHAYRTRWRRMWRSALQAVRQPERGDVEREGRSAPGPPRTPRRGARPLAQRAGEPRRGVALYRGERPDPQARRRRLLARASPAGPPLGRGPGTRRLGRPAGGAGALARGRGLRPALDRDERRPQPLPQELPRRGGGGGWGDGGRG